jgi:hypothetical protein
VIGREDGPGWDSIVVVRYPWRAKFLEMIRHPDYEKVTAHRVEALETSGLIATDPWSVHA